MLLTVLATTAESPLSLLSFVPLPHTNARHTTDPFSSNILDVIEESLQRGKATCVAFNRRGTLLAAGTTDGIVVIWDFETRSVAREFKDGARDKDEDGGVAVLSVSWSRDGRKIISAAADDSMSVWNVDDDDGDADPQLGRYTFQAPLHHVQFCPTNASLALVSQVQDGPIIFALNRSRKKTPLPQFAGSVDRASYVCRMPSTGLSLDASISMAAYAVYSRSGKFVFVANHRGMVTVVETSTMDIVQALRVPEVRLGCAFEVHPIEVQTPPPPEPREGKGGGWTTWGPRGGM